MVTLTSTEKAPSNYTASATSRATTASACVLVDESKFLAVFEAANRASWIGVTQDPVLSAGLSAASAQVTAVAAALLSNCDALCGCEHILSAFFM